MPRRVLRVDRRTVLASEDEVLVFVGVAPVGTFHALAELVAQQYPEGVRVEVDFPVFA